MLKASPELMQDQGRVLVLKVGCYLATSSQVRGLSWVELVGEVQSRWFESKGKGGVSHGGHYTRFAFGVHTCAYICIYALHTIVCNCGNVRAHIYALIKINS